MENLFKLGNKTFDIRKLLAVGEVQNIHSGLLSVELDFPDKSTIAAYFISGENGAPNYHNSKEDVTEWDSDFWRYAEAEVIKLREAMNRL